MKNKGSWKKERASFSTTEKTNYRSNKYRIRKGADKSVKSPNRKKFWVGAHKRNGKKVKGYYRKLN